MRFINTVLCIILGGLFILSGYLKLYPIEPFEYNFVRLGVANWFTAPIISRALIGLEFGLGLMLLLQLHLKKFTLRATLYLLLFFSVYLVYQLIAEGNTGNCGCFGTYLEMTPLESLIKNAMMIGAVMWLIITGVFPNNIFTVNKTVAQILLLTIILTSLVLPYTMNIPEFMTHSQYDKSAQNYILDLSNLYENNAEAPKLDLRKGKQILSLMSLKCEHCKMAAFKMAIMYKRHPDLPFFILYKGNVEKNLTTFFQFTHANNIPYIIYNTNDFVTLSGGELPAIYWLNNGVVEHTSTYLDLDENDILRWVKEP